MKITAETRRMATDAKSDVLEAVKAQPGQRVTGTMDEIQVRLEVQNEHGTGLLSKRSLKASLDDWVTDGELLGSSTTTAHDRRQSRGRVYTYMVPRERV